MLVVALRSAFALVVLCYTYREARYQAFLRRRGRVVDALKLASICNQITALDACELVGQIINDVRDEEPLYEILYRPLISVTRGRKDDPISALQSSIAGVQFLAFASTQTDLDQGASLVCKILKNTVRNTKLGIVTQDIKKKSGQRTTPLGRKWDKPRSCANIISTWFRQVPVFSGFDGC